MGEIVKARADMPLIPCRTQKSEPFGLSLSLSKARRPARRFDRLSVNGYLLNERPLE